MDKVLFILLILFIISCLIDIANLNRMQRSLEVIFNTLKKEGIEIWKE